MIDYILILLVAAGVVLLARFLMSVKGKELLVMISNVVVATLVLYLINISGFTYIRINIITIFVVAAFGLPGVIILMILAIMGVL